MGWMWAALILGVLLAMMSGATMYEHRRATELAVENTRWRELAQDRADRVAVVSHELRTPLTLISGAAELLADQVAGPVTPRQASLVDTIAVKAREVLTLAGDLLTDARIDAQLFQFKPSTVDMRRLANSVVRDLRRLHPNQITLSARGAAPRIVGDPDLIRQALTNLVTNSARHAGTDARINVTVRSSEEGVLIVVRDDGSGMTAAQTRELFRRSLAGKSETGTGLGMLITRRIIELHGGRCMVDSMVDHGTAILCSLPRDAHPRLERGLVGPAP